MGHKLPLVQLLAKGGHPALLDHSRGQRRGPGGLAYGDCLVFPAHPRTEPWQENRLKSSSDPSGGSKCPPLPPRH